MRNQDPLDAFLDLALEEDLGTIFWNANNGGDWNAMGEILRSPYVLIGTSDAGAMCYSALTSVTARRCWDCGCANVKS